MLKISLCLLLFTLSRRQDSWDAKDNKEIQGSSMSYDEALKLAASGVLTDNVLDAMKWADV